MKKYSYLLILIFAISGLISCSDSFLDQGNPNAESTTEFWKTQEQLSEGLDATYRSLRFNGVYSRWLHILYISRSDEGYSTSPDANFKSYSDFLTRNNDNTEGVFYPWLDMYKGIFWANQVIDAAPAIEMDNSLREQIVGEATFVRGVYYFNLAGVYGRGVITLTALATNNNRVIVEQDGMYEQARKDFELAAENGRLPIIYSNAGKDLGRITQGAALGMLAKVYAQEKNWTKVEEVCRKLMTLPGATYKLVDNYADNFSASTENNSESIFEVQFRAERESGIELGNQRPKFMGIPGPSFDDATASNIIQTDLEREQTMANTPDPRLKATIFYYDPANPNEQLYGRNWDGWGLNRSKVYWKKYTNYNTRTDEDFNSGINIRVLRLADIYLLYAEALNELGRTSESYEYINKVRARVNLPNLENSTVFTGIGNDKAKMRTQIMHERFCELTGECWRWLDLERWGMFDNETNLAYLKARDYEFNNFVIGKSNRFPIPYREIPLVKGLKQNPGYY